MHKAKERTNACSPAVAQASVDWSPRLPSWPRSARPGAGWKPGLHDRRDACPTRRLRACGRAPGRKITATCP